MAEFTCFECGKTVKSGEKFTFTKGGSIHLDCFISSKRKNLSEDKVERLRHLSQILDSELQHMIQLFSIRSEDEQVKQLIKNKIKEIEKASGETTRMIYEL
jgi:hypothetical protein